MVKIRIDRLENGSAQVYFQPETTEESQKLDEILGFNGHQKPIFEEFARKKDDELCDGYIGGHESARWIMIPSDPTDISKI